MARSVCSVRMEEVGYSMMFQFVGCRERERKEFYLWMLWSKDGPTANV